MKTFLIILSLLSLYSCGGSKESGALTIDTVSGESVKWDSLPITLNVSLELKNSRPDLTDAIESAADSWDAALGQDVFNIQYVTIPTSKLSYTICNQYIDDLQTLIFKNSAWNTFSCNNNPIGDRTLAITLFSKDRNNKLQHVDIIFNDNIYNFNSDPRSGEIDLESVVLHEMGHALGLKHICKSSVEDSQNSSYNCVDGEYDPSSVMNPTIQSVEEKRNLSPDDLLRVQELYN